MLVGSSGGNPKHMHHATYQRLVNDYEKRGAVALVMSMNWLLRLGDRMATKRE